MGHRNYHTHTYHCKHAQGAPIDYCREALKQGVSVLGITDHAPQADGKWETKRMDMSELDTYFQEIRDAQAAFPQLIVHAGLECEFRPDLGNFVKDAFLDTPDRCEYLILAIHDFIARDGEWTSSWSLRDSSKFIEYAEFAAKGMSTGLYKILAHPDLFLIGRTGWDDTAAAAARIIAEASVAYNVPLEINAAGLRRPLITDSKGRVHRPYPYPPFWEIIAEYPVSVVTSSDAHTPEDVWKNTGDAEAFGRYYGLNFISEEELFPSKTK